MAKPKTLRVVAANETAPKARAPRKPRAKTITQAAESGTVLEQLVALRTRVAKTVEDPNCPPRDLAALSRRLIEIAKEIAAIEAAEAEEVGGATATPDEDWQAI